MITNAKQYKCGGCGNDTYYIYGKEDNDQQIFSECKECGSVSIIEISKPKLIISWGENSHGLMTFFD